MSNTCRHLLRKPPTTQTPHPSRPSASHTALLGLCDTQVCADAVLLAWTRASLCRHSFLLLFMWAVIQFVFTKLLLSDTNPGWWTRFCLRSLSRTFPPNLSHIKWIRQKNKSSFSLRCTPQVTHPARMVRTVCLGGSLRSGAQLLSGALPPRCVWTELQCCGYMSRAGWLAAPLSLPPSLSFSQRRQSCWSELLRAAASPSRIQANYAHGDPLRALCNFSL